MKNTLRLFLIMGLATNAVAAPADIEINLGALDKFRKPTHSVFEVEAPKPTHHHQAVKPVLNEPAVSVKKPEQVKKILPPKKIMPKKPIKSIKTSVPKVSKPKGQSLPPVIIEKKVLEQTPLVTPQIKPEVKPEVKPDPALPPVRQPEPALPVQTPVMPEPELPKVIMPEPIAPAQAPKVPAAPAQAPELPAASQVKAPELKVKPVPEIPLPVAPVVKGSDNVAPPPPPLPQDIPLPPPPPLSEAPANSHNTKIEPVSNTMVERKALALSFTEGVEISPEAKKSLNNMVKSLERDNDKTIKVVGYIGDSKNQDAERRNALKRTIGVRKYLTDHGIDSSLINVQIIEAGKKMNRAAISNVDLYLLTQVKSK